MPVAVLVVEGRAALNDSDEFLRLDRLREAVRGCKDILGQVQHGAPIAIGHADERLPRIGRKRQRLAQHRLCAFQ